MEEKRSVVVIGATKKFIVFDVETAGSFGYPLIYDIGIIVADRNGRTYAEKSFVINEIFYNRGYMQNAFYSKKRPQYLREIEEGKHTVTEFAVMREEFFKLIRDYKVGDIYAYNFPFDGRALKSTHELLTKEPSFFTAEFQHVKKHCIWTMACELIFSQTKFIRTALEKGWVTEKGNVFTNAEIAYRYLSGQDNFEEEHMGLSDCKIELFILNQALAKKRKFSTTVIHAPWRIPNKKRKILQKADMEKNEKELQKNDNLSQEP